MISRFKELLFQNRSTKQTVAKNVFWLSFSEIATRFIRGIIVIYAARILGVAEFGIFSYALGLAGLFTIFSDIGIMQILTRELAQKPEERDRYFATAFIIKSVLLISTALAIAFLAPLFSLKTAVKLMPLMALLVFFDGIRDFSLSFFRALEKMEITAFVTLLTNITIVGAGIMALWHYGTSTALATTYVIGAGAGAFTAAMLLRKEYGKVWKSFDKKLVRQIVSYSWPLLFMGMLGSFMLNTDNVLIGWFLGEADVGLYAAAQKVVQILYILPAIIASATFPTIARYIASNDSAYIKSIIEKSMSMVFLIAIPIAVGGIILAEPIILFLYKTEFLSSVVTFRILILTVLLTFPGIIIGNLGLAYNRQRDFAKYVGFAALFNTVFDAILIPIYGIAGSAAVTVLAQLITNSLGWRHIKKINNFKTFRYLTKITLAAIVMGTITFTLSYLDINVLLNILISGVLYFAALYIAKEQALQEIIGMVRRV